MDAVTSAAPTDRSRKAAVVWALRVSILPFALARLLVAAALVLAHLSSRHHHYSAAALARIHEGLLGWDAGWYESIARQGYAGAGHASLRFFPLFPALGRAVAVLPGLSVGTALVLVANGSALVGTALLASLVRFETGEEALARRAAWLLCLAPAAFTYVMGYAEGTLLALAVAMFFVLRAQRFWWAALLGLAAGLTRPLGALLFLPAAVEAYRFWRAGAAPRTSTSSAPPSSAAMSADAKPADVKPADAKLIDARLIGPVAAVVGPLLGTGAFLGWVGWRYGNALTPLREQTASGHHGLADPLVTLAHDASDLLHGHHLGEGLHLPWVLLALALLVVVFRRWPLSYGLFAAAVLVVALTGSNLDSFERYGLSAFPLVLAGAGLTASRRVRLVVYALSAIGLVGYALLAFTNVYVP